MKKTTADAVKAAVEAAKSEMLLEHSAGFIETEGLSLSNICVCVCVCVCVCLCICAH